MQVNKNCKYDASNNGRKPGYKKVVTFLAHPVHANIRYSSNFGVNSKLYEMKKAYQEKPPSWHSPTGKNESDCLCDLAFLLFWRKSGRLTKNLIRQKSLLFSSNRVGQTSAEKARKRIVWNENVIVRSRYRNSPVTEAGVSRRSMSVCLRATVRQHCECRQTPLTTRGHSIGSPPVHTSRMIN